MGGAFQSPSSNKSELEEGAAFTPRFDADGLIPPSSPMRRAAVS
jgi:hypothetical protein